VPRPYSPAVTVNQRLAPAGGRPPSARLIHQHPHSEAGTSWRIIYRIDPDAIVILEVFAKTTRRTPQRVIEICKGRLKQYDSVG
jgi:Phage derived protein Gp49-like (DUF891)